MTTTKNIILRSLLLATTISILSCSDFFIKEIDIPRQEMDNQLVVHGFVSDIDTNIYFVLAKNYALHESVPKIDDTWVTDATINIIAENGSEHELKYTKKYYEKELDQAFGGAGQNFSIEVSHPDYVDAYIETSMPEYVEPSHRDKPFR